LSGACETYHLDKGERQNASYRVYHSCPDHKLTQYWSVEKGDNQAHDYEQCENGDTQLLAGRGSQQPDHH
jgi:hypothetical protein